MGKERVPIRCDPETKDALSDYADDKDISQSEAGRRALRAYLANEGYNIATADGLGAVDELSALREELGALEQRQAEYRQAQRRTERRQTLAVLAGALYLVAFTTLDVGGLLWAAVGAVGVVAIALATWQQSRMEER